MPANCTMEDSALSESFSRMDEEDIEGSPFHEGVKLGEFCRSDIQVAINEGNRRGHTFFVIRIGKAGISMPFQQPIPLDFARFHPKLHLEDVTLEGPCGRVWNIIIRPLPAVVRFGKGWRQFSLENHLREGYQLLFHLVEKSRFVVQFFDNLGKRHFSFPPLTPVRAPAVVEFSPLETPYAKPDTPQSAKPVALDSTRAKLILRQCFPQLNGSPSTRIDPKFKVSIPYYDKLGHSLDNEDGIETEFVGNQGSDEEQATEEGKAYKLLHSDDDDELVYCHESSADMQTLAEAITKKRRKAFIVEDTDSSDSERISEDDELYSGEQTGLQSSKVFKVEHTQQDHGEFQRDPEKTCRVKISVKHRERQRPVSKDLGVKRLLEGQRGNAPAKLTKSNHHRDARGEKLAATKNGHRDRVNDSFSRRDAERKKVVGASTESLSPAKRLLEHQGCWKFSEIVSKSKRRAVSDKERSRALKAANTFASALRNENFMVVMRDAQVYHGFQLGIPRGFLELTGTVLTRTLKVCLIDKHHTFYEANWAWHALCKTPLLNCDGWASFALDHMLEEGDVCVFELLDPDPAFLFLVHIFRVVETPMELSSSTYELCGSQTPFNKKFGIKVPAAKNAYRIELGRGRAQMRPIQKLHSLHSWTKLVKPRLLKNHFGGNRGQRQY